MLKIEKTLQSIRDLLDRLGKEDVEFALVESEYSDYVADIRNPNKVYVFLECSIRPNGHHLRFQGSGRTIGDLRDHAPVLRVQPESSCDRPGA